jgi:hypothetical protein
MAMVRYTYVFHVGWRLGGVRTIKRVDGGMFCVHGEPRDVFPTNWHYANRCHEAFRGDLH